MKKPRFGPKAPKRKPHLSLGNVDYDNALAAYRGKKLIELVRQPLGELDLFGSRGMLKR